MPLSFLQWELRGIWCGWPGRGNVSPPGPALPSGSFVVLAQPDVDAERRQGFASQVDAVQRLGDDGQDVSHVQPRDGVAVAGDPHRGGHVLDVLDETFSLVQAGGSQAGGVVDLVLTGADDAVRTVWSNTGIGGVGSGAVTDGLGDRFAAGHGSGSFLCCGPGIRPLAIPGQLAEGDP